MIQPPYNILDDYYGRTPYASISEAKEQFALFFAFAELGPEEREMLHAEIADWLWAETELWDFDPL